MKPSLLIAFCLLSIHLRSQTVEITGVIQDSNGDPLPLANIFILPDSVLSNSDLNGSFSVQVSKGSKTIIVSYVGFEPVASAHELNDHAVVNFTLSSMVGQLEEVVIAEDRFSNEDIVHSAATGKHTLTSKDILQMPALLGEANPLKSVRLLPGSAGGMEGSSDTFVRGGAADQNLVLLDGAPIYNTGHLLGFLSVFNPDILDKVDVINGGFPAAFGGRLSSVLNISTISKVANETKVSADVGLISSRIKLEQPVLKNKASVWIAARQSYVDKLVEQVFDKKIPYSFYDVNGKLILHPTKSDQIEISHYGSEDFLDFLVDKDGDGNGMVTTFHSRNTSESFKWRHQAINKWRNELSMFHTYFDYDTKNAFDQDYLVSAHSKIEDYGVKLAIEKDSVWNEVSVSAGVEWIRHQMSPKVLNSEGSITDIVQSGSSNGKIAQEFAAYVQQEMSLTKKLSVSAGIRASMGSVTRRQYIFPEPRVSVRYAIASDQAVKINYSRMVQYVHRISNSAVSTPIDVWFPVTDSIRPQTSHQFALAWQAYVPARKVYCSVEGYYKSMKNLIGYEEGTNFLFKSDFDSRLIQGKGNAYGLEFLIRKDAGKFTGWISYTLSWSWRKYDELNNAEWFHARYDRRHNGAIVTQHQIAKRWAASLVWEYISGSRFTPVVGQYTALAPNGGGLDLIPIFAKVNSVKLSDAHRLDLGMKFFSKPGRKFQWHWFAGVYNVYNRATPFGIVIKRDKTNNSLKYAQPGLFGFLPFISYGCKL